jgi:hypothetical protein
MLDPGYEIRPQPIRAPGDLQAGYATEELLEYNSNLKPGQGGTEADVASGSECHVVVRLAF